MKKYKLKQAIITPEGTATIGTESKIVGEGYFFGYEGKGQRGYYLKDNHAEAHSDWFHEIKEEAPEQPFVWTDEIVKEFVGAVKKEGFNTGVKLDYLQTAFKMGKKSPTPSSEASADRSVRMGNDNICPITKQQCDDETCTPGAECNISGDKVSSGKPEPKKDWEILTCQLETGDIHKYEPVWCLGNDKEGSLRCVIHSVKRLSDNTTWTVKQSAGHKEGSHLHGKIERFEIYEDDISALMSNGSWIGIKYLQNEPQQPADQTDKKERIWVKTFPGYESENVCKYVYRFATNVPFKSGLWPGIKGAIEQVLNFNEEQLNTFLHSKTILWQQMAKEKQSNVNEQTDTWEKTLNFLIQGQAKRIVELEDGKEKAERNAWNAARSTNLPFDTISEPVWASFEEWKEHQNKNKKS